MYLTAENNVGGVVAAVVGAVVEAVVVIVGTVILVVLIFNRVPKTTDVSCL